MNEKVNKHLCFKSLVSKIAADHVVLIIGEHCFCKMKIKSLLIKDNHSTNRLISKWHRLQDAKTNETDYDFRDVKQQKGRCLNQTEAQILHIISLKS